MTGNFLYPPSSNILSDNVIDGVVQRVASLHHNCEDNREVYRIYTSARNFGNADSQHIHRFMSRKWQPPLESLPSMPSSSYPVSQHEAVPPRKLRTPASRRERCRINQARYRKRQRKHADDLDKTLQQLKDEVQDLETRSQKMLRCAPTNENVWIVASEYFRLFRNGYVAPTAEAKLSSSPTFIFDVYKAKQSHPQLDFFRTNLSPDVIDGTLCGADALLENWRLLSLYFGDVQVKLKRLERDGNVNSLVGKTMTSLTVTDKTLRNVFPHLISSGELSPLALRLFNQKLVMRGSVRFDWDATSGRVVRLESKVDLLSTMLKLLGNLKDVERVLRNSLISPEGKFIIC